MATPFRLKRSSVTGKRPALEDVQIGELAFNFYDGHLFAERDTGGVGIATTVALLTPWKENFGGGSITYVGVVTANTYHGDQVIGTPAGGFKSGAFTINNSDHTKDSINELNFILGKLVPDAPDTFNGLALSLTGTAGVGRLCQGFTPTNNTGGSAPSAGTQYTRNTDSTITTNYINDIGPGDVGTVTGFVNAVGVGTTTLNTGINNATSGAVQIADNKDAAQSTRNTGITSQFYQVYDVRLLNAASPDGFNKAFLTHSSATTGEVFWYEDPSTVSAPVISFSNITEPPSPSFSYSSGIPHYTQASANNFTYTLTVTNATGDMYSNNTFVTQDNNSGTAFANSGNKSYTNFAGGTNPPTQNYGVGSGVTTLVTNTFRNIHSTITSNHFTRYDASTPYGSHNNQRISYSTPLNIMGTTARPNQIDEDSITNFGSNDGVRVKAGSNADNPSATFVAWTGGSIGGIDTYEATVRGGVLRHDQTNYSTGYLPVGPNYSVGRSGAQYYQVLLEQEFISSFKIIVTGSYGGCWVCMPNNSAWNTSLSGKNGWADMFTAYRGAGIPTTAEPGCATGTVMSGSSGTFTCTFGTESSSNNGTGSSPFRILIRWRLDAGDSITAMSYTT
jgi:hypothetical protein